MIWKPLKSFELFTAVISHQKTKTACHTTTSLRSLQNVKARQSENRDYSIWCFRSRRFQPQYDTSATYRLTSEPPQNKGTSLLREPIYSNLSWASLCHFVWSCCWANARRNVYNRQYFSSGISEISSFKKIIELFYYLWLRRKSAKDDCSRDKVDVTLYFGEAVVHWSN